MKIELSVGLQATQVTGCVCAGGCTREATFIFKVGNNNRFNGLLFSWQLVFLGDWEKKAFLFLNVEIKVKMKPRSLAVNQTTQLLQPAKEDSTLSSKFSHKCMFELWKYIHLKIPAAGIHSTGSVHMLAAKPNLKRITFIHYTAHLYLMESICSVFSYKRTQCFPYHCMTWQPSPDSGPTL